MSYEFEKCLKNRSIVKEEISENMVLAEMEAARYDLK